MCGYEFNKFFDVKDIDNEQDLEIQEKFLAKINELIDCGHDGICQHDKEEMEENKNGK